MLARPSIFTTVLRWTSVGIWGFVNVLFGVKYFARYTEAYPLLVALFLALAGAGLVVLWRRAAPVSPRLFWAVFSGAVVGSVALLLAIDYETVRVDRWIMIDTFLTQAANGVYPYIPPPGGNIPGPLPVYYLLAAPFHYLGDIGWLTVLALAGYAALVRTWWGTEARTGARAVGALLLLAGAIPFWWEVAVRSTIAANAILVIGYLFLLHRARPRTVAALVGYGLIGGLVLSTRSVFALPYVLYLMYAYVRPGHWRRLFLLGGAMALGFALTIVPLYFWDAELFFVYNPLLVQSTLSAGPVVGILLVLALGLSWRCRSFEDVLGTAALLIFLSVCYAFGIRVAEFGWAETLAESRFDISYFTLALPFAALVLAEAAMPALAHPAEVTA